MKVTNKSMMMALAAALLMSSVPVEGTFETASSVKGPPKSKGSSKFKNAATSFVQDISNKKKLAEPLMIESSEKKYVNGEDKTAGRPETSNPQTFDKNQEESVDSISNDEKLMKTLKFCAAAFQMLPIENSAKKLIISDTETDTASKTKAEVSSDSVVEDNKENSKVIEKEDPKLVTTDKAVKDNTVTLAVNENNPELNPSPVLSQPPIAETSNSATNEGTIIPQNNAMTAIFDQVKLRKKDDENDMGNDTVASPTVQVLESTAAGQTSDESDQDDSMYLESLFYPVPNPNSTGSDTQISATQPPANADTSSSNIVEITSAPIDEVLTVSVNKVDASQPSEEPQPILTGNDNIVLSSGASSENSESATKILTSTSEPSPAANLDKGKPLESAVSESNPLTSVVNPPVTGAETGPQQDTLTNNNDSKAKEWSIWTIMSIFGGGILFVVLLIVGYLQFRKPSDELADV